MSNVYSRMAPYTQLCQKIAPRTVLSIKAYIRFRVNSEGPWTASGAPLVLTRGFASRTRGCLGGGWGEGRV